MVRDRRRPGAHAAAFVRRADARTSTITRTEDAAVGQRRARAVGASPSDRYRTLEMERTVERFEGDSGSDDVLAAASGGRALRRSSWSPKTTPTCAGCCVHLLGAEFRVRPPATGARRSSFVRERAPALVVTDVMMPEMSGTELCEAIKSDPALAGVPVMLVTSKAEREMKIRGLELGADDYVTKPFHPRELVARARSLVRLRASAARARRAERGARARARTPAADRGGAGPGGAAGGGRRAGGRHRARGQQPRELRARTRCAC